MISDVLSEAGADIRDYLDRGAYGERGEPLRDWIESVAAQMEALRAHLDAGPPPVAITADVTLFPDVARAAAEAAAAVVPARRTKEGLAGK